MPENGELGAEIFVLFQPKIFLIDSVELPFQLLRDIRSAELPEIPRLQFVFHDFTP